ncbi:hypothetical protein N7456_004508 [Penicillium angulare]|uniref:Uncharacterized protein n=1 Tax=Penicillium angulare TaxID=116970 RepID=A0A9W9KJM8_9EURO|nr:hypothetical protein N7456_004508 [Penicillium angulare]
MPFNFLSLSGELRNEIYENLILSSEPINPWSGKKELVTNILLANRQVLDEARSLLYGKNCFELVVWKPDLVPSFLDAIGSVNASYIRFIRIEFPAFYDLKDEVSLEKTSVDILEKIQKHCTNLRSITIGALTTYLVEIRLDQVDNPAIYGKALALIATRLNAIKSLQKVVVEVYEEAPSLDIRKEMESHGWQLKVVPRVEDVENAGSGEDVDEEVYRYSDENEDDEELYLHDDYDDAYYGEDDIDF